MSGTKLLLFSDPHLTGTDAPVSDCKTDGRFAACLKQALKRHSDAAHILLLGDLSETDEGYAFLAKQLAQTDIPATCLMGNEDDRDVFRKAFPTAPEGFQHGTLTFGNHQLIYLDTLDPDPTPKFSGVLCADRIAFLKDALNQSQGMQITLIMHHPPIQIGSPFFDPIGLRNGEELVDLASAANVSLIITGHVHMAAMAIVGGMSMTTLRSTGFGLRDGDDGGVEIDPTESGAYGVVALTEKGAVLRHEACMAEPVRQSRLK